MRIYVSEQIPEAIKNALCKYGDVFLLPPFERLAPPVCCHADMLMFYSDVKKKVILPGEYYNVHSQLFKGIKVDVADEEFLPEYPFDIRLDGCRVGGYLFCKEKYTSEKVKEGYLVIDVKQGYAGCSVLAVNSKAIISSDKGICRAAKALGIDALSISAGSIMLDGYSYGFIGGASFVVNNDVVFFGNIAAHPDFNEIKSFLKKYNMNIVNFESIPLTDYGSACYIDIGQYNKTV